MSGRIRGSDRETLKGYFSEGRLPSGKNFAELIESTLNLRDDCFQWRQDYGFEISVRGDDERGRLLSFFRTPDDDVPDWSILSDKTTGALHFVAAAKSGSQGTASPVDPGALTLSSNGGKVGIGVAAPACDLDVAGTIKSSGRMGEGGLLKGKVPANGKWQDITEELTGCHAFEVMAGVGGAPGKGRFSLLHAYAMNTNNPTGWLRNFLNLKKRIRCDHAWYGSRGDKLKLRWAPTTRFHYKLQMKSNSNFGSGVNIRFSFTRLWFDPDMKQCATASAPAAAGKTA
ncbi:MAG TPA: hypothetical protein VHZ55_04020 [Bryobacteraceae bacterium]|jgi:hypothetical protein|nr:hypothetical protein [Bryobacteraceae bacterium]